MTLLLASCALLSSCSSLEFSRDSETGGTFHSSGVGFTIFSIDMPKRAIDIARENASDARRPNMQVEREVIFPYLGPFDWLLDIIAIRYASISGTWGFPPETTGADAR